MTMDSLQADKGDWWKFCDSMERGGAVPFVEAFRQAMHDRDRFQRERDWLRENCGYAALAPCWEQRT